MPGAQRRTTGLQSPGARRAEPMGTSTSSSTLEGLHMFWMPFAPKVKNVPSTIHWFLLLSSLPFVLLNNATTKARTDGRDRHDGWGPYHRRSSLPAFRCENHELSPFLGHAQLSLALLFLGLPCFLFSSHYVLFVSLFQCLPFSSLLFSLRVNGIGEPA